MTSALSWVPVHSCPLFPSSGGQLESMRSQLYPCPWTDRGRPSPAWRRFQSAPDCPLTPSSLYTLAMPKASGKARVAKSTCLL